MKISKKTRVRIGIIKFCFERLKGYWATASFSGTMYLVIKESGIDPVLVAASIIVLSIFISWLDLRYIYPEESAEGWRRNAEFKKFLRKKE